MVCLNFENDEPIRHELSEEHSIKFCRAVVDKIAHNGVWVVPRSNTVFLVDHQNKRLLRMHAGTPGDEELIVNKMMFAKIGWTVTDHPEGVTRDCKKH